VPRAKADPDAPALPHNLEAERALLGAAMLSPAAADYVADHLSVDAFYRQAHQLVFAGIQTLRHQGSEVDLVTLRQVLGPSKTSQVGVAYLSGLVDGVPRATHVAHYAGILTDLLTKRSLVTYAQQVIGRVAENGQSGAQLVAEADRSLLALQAGYQNGRMAQVADTLPMLIEDMEHRYTHKGELLGLSSGFKSIDDLTFGWQAGDLIILAARPSIGKTTLALNTATATGLAGGRVAIFSLEMRRRQLEYRMVSTLSRVPLSQLLTGYLNEGDWPSLSQTWGTLGELRLAIDDTTGRTVHEMRSECRRLKAEGGLDLVIVDYVQLIPGTLDRRGATRNEEITDISRRLKTLADEGGFPVLLLSQLSRPDDRKPDARPKLTDLRDCGALEQDADVVAFLHRKQHKESGSTEFIVETARNGPTGTVLLTLDRDTTTFTDGGEPIPEPTAAEQQAERKVKQVAFFKQRARKG
jgi:replicative DNA helicase